MPTKKKTDGIVPDTKTPEVPTPASVALQLQKTIDIADREIGKELFTRMFGDNPMQAKDIAREWLALPKSNAPSGGAKDRPRAVASYISRRAAAWRFHVVAGVGEDGKPVADYAQVLSELGATNATLTITDCHNATSETVVEESLRETEATKTSKPRNHKTPDEKLEAVVESFTKLLTNPALDEDAFKYALGKMSRKLQAVSAKAKGDQQALNAE